MSENKKFRNEVKGVEAVVSSLASCLFELPTCELTYKYGTLQVRLNSIEALSYYLSYGIRKGIIDAAASIEGKDDSASYTKAITERESKAYEGRLRERSTSSDKVEIDQEALAALSPEKQKEARELLELLLKPVVKKR